MDILFRELLEGEARAFISNFIVIFFLKNKKAKRNKDIICFFCKELLFFHIFYGSSIVSNSEKRYIIEIIAMKIRSQYVFVRTEEECG